jgi:hypothetical protein
MTSTPRSVENFDIDKKSMDATKHEHVEITSDGITWTPEEEKKILRKIDLQLMPIMWLMYLLSYMDRTK